MSDQPTFKTKSDGTQMVDTTACRALYDHAAGELSLLVYTSSMKEGYPVRRFRFSADAMEASRIIGLTEIDWGDGAGMAGTIVYGNLPDPKDFRTRPFSIVEGLEAPMTAETVKISISRLSSACDRETKADQREWDALRMSDLQNVHIGIEHGEGRPVMLMVTGNLTSQDPNSFQSKLTMLPNGSEVLAQGTAWRIRGEWRDLVIVPETALALHRDERSRGKEATDETLTTLFARSGDTVKCCWRFGTDAAGRDIAIHDVAHLKEGRVYAVGEPATALKALAGNATVRDFYERNPSEARHSYITLSGADRSTVVNGSPLVEFRAQEVAKLANTMEALVRPSAARAPSGAAR